MTKDNNIIQITLNKDDLINKNNINININIEENKKDNNENQELIKSINLKLNEINFDNKIKFNFKNKIYSLNNFVETIDFINDYIKKNKSNIYKQYELFFDKNIIIGARTKIYYILIINKLFFYLIIIYKF